MSQVFAFQSHQIRTLAENSEIWFAAIDVCRALTISWRGNTLANIPDEWKRTIRNFRMEGFSTRDLVFISEPAVYKLAFRSNKPEADTFTNWVAAEVLPSIRKTGGYSAQPAQLALPAPDADARLDSHFLRLRALAREMREIERAVYGVIKENRGDTLNRLDARRSVCVNMHTTMDRLFYAIDYAVEAAEAHAKSMCIMNRV